MRGAGALAGYHAGPPRRERRAAGRKKGTLLRLHHAAKHLSAVAARRLPTAGDLHLEGDRRVLFPEFRPELQPEYRQDGYSGPEYVYTGPRENTRLGGMSIRTIEEALVQEVKEHLGFERYERTGAAKPAHQHRHH